MPAICGVEMAKVATPATVEELQSVVVDAIRGNAAIFPRGGGTAMDIGRPPELPTGREGVVVDLTKLNRVIDYPAEDMTITVEAGIRMTDLADVLAGNGQMLPLDPALPAQATLGGVLATRWCGTRRYGYGSPRDYVLGVKYIDAQARRIKGGGSVVKNVAGYDLMKMQIGAFGSLGIIAQATLKLRPLPEASAAVAVPLATTKVKSALELLHRSKTRPVGIEIVDQLTAQTLALPCEHISTEFSLIVLFEECREAVDWQVRQLTEELNEIGLATASPVVADRYAKLLLSLSDWPERNPSRTLISATFLPSSSAEFCHAVAQAQGNLELLLHAGNGVALVRSANEDLASTLELVGDLEAAIVSASGKVAVPRCSNNWKAAVPVWGKPHPDWPLMRRIKTTLDPTDVFNPGRLRLA